jgi:hypothetical protein
MIMAISRAPFIYSILRLSTFTFAVIVIPLTLNLPKPYESTALPATSDYDLLVNINPNLKRANGPKEILTQSIDTMQGGINVKSGIYAAQDSFVRGAIDASAKH